MRNKISSLIRAEVRLKKISVELVFVKVFLLHVGRHIFLGLLVSLFLQQDSKELTQRSRNTA